MGGAMKHGRDSGPSAGGGGRERGSAGSMSECGWDRRNGEGFRDPGEGRAEMEGGWSWESSSHASRREAAGQGLPRTRNKGSAKTRAG